MKILAKYPTIVLVVELTEMEARNLRFFLLNATQNAIQGKEEAHDLGYAIEQQLSNNLSEG